MNVRSNLRAGDRINLVRYENDTWGRVLEVMEGIRVTAVDNAGVELMTTFDLVSLNRPGEQGVVVARGFAGQFVIRVDGDTNATRNTLVEANEYATQLAADSGRPLTLYESKRKGP